ncbi:hypothetical protein PAXINDRAFT_173418 [Paxillus involutus ATCC 200175]|uniref:Uncharacterized protein n=1 Tax=Paxillus involutus ATCC 200175 TaxID=664439 RepID=A0A0C9TJT9_PAXIN|nr:hypothetical protein PAXINDRAFT_173418 [Paxillus involutus ATCC 200175]
MLACTPRSMYTHHQGASSQSRHLGLPENNYVGGRRSTSRSHIASSPRYLRMFDISTGEQAAISKRNEHDICLLAVGVVHCSFI